MIYAVQKTPLKVNKKIADKKKTQLNSDNLLQLRRHVA